MKREGEGEKFINEFNPKIIKPEGKIELKNDIITDKENYTKEKACLSCGRLGHSATNCPEANIKLNKNKFATDIEYRCSKCGLLGHLDENCPTHTESL